MKTYIIILTHFSHMENNFSKISLLNIPDYNFYLKLKLMDKFCASLIYAER